MAHERDDPPESALPAEPVQRIIGPLRAFVHVEAASGVVLLLAAVTAVALANSPFAESFLGIWKTHFAIELGSFSMDHSLKHWISDGLMAIFFFVIGLEVKRELVQGELRELRQAALPIAAALGGMVVPAALYLLLQAGEPAARGWGIPMATDIAFLLGCLTLLGKRVPEGLRVLLLSLAIGDDIGAILVIAIGYTSEIHVGGLVLAGGALGLVLLMRRIGVRFVPVYVFVGSLLWLGLHESGVHATLAGVILGLLTPSSPWVSGSRMRRIFDQTADVWSGTGGEAIGSRRGLLDDMRTAAREVEAPLDRLERTMHPWSAFLIMPIFALANAGIDLDPGMLLDDVALAVALGLCVGKPLGIVGVSFIAVRLGLASLPAGVSWRMLLGGGMLAGIGFTMSLFIAGLALEGTLRETAGAGVLVASVVSGALGMLILALSPRTEE